MLWPGVGPMRKGLLGSEDQRIGERTYHSYYQWMGVFLLLQAACFYFPHLLWKACEGGRIKQLCKDLEIITGEEKSLKLR